MRVFDCFLFFRELELLDIRLHTHAPWAHAFVVAESPRTFSNLPRKLMLDTLPPAVREFAPRVRRIVTSNLNWPEASGGKLGKQQRMKLNGEQWECIKQGLYDADPDDMLVLTDIDEILRPEAVEKAKQIVRERGHVRFAVTMYSYALNMLRHPHWCGPVAVRAGNVLDKSLWEFRQTLRVNTSAPTIKDAGWHFTSLGTIPEIQDKLRSAAHTEYDRFLDDPVALKKWIADGHPFAPNNDPAGVVKPVPVDASFPEYLCANLGRFKHLLRNPW